jgi:hypothetical protein
METSAFSINSPDSKMSFLPQDKRSDTLSYKHPDKPGLPKLIEEQRFPALTNVNLHVYSRQTNHSKIPTRIFVEIHIAWQTVVSSNRSTNSSLTVRPCVRLNDFAAAIMGKCTATL